MNKYRTARVLLLVVLVSLWGGQVTLGISPNEVFRDAQKIVTNDGIQEDGMVLIGGIQQWVSVRGRHRSNPILLFLHGGPGFTSSPVSYFFMKDWEEYFTVVQWDQRGAGKTFAANPPSPSADDLSIERVVEDADEFSRYLCQTYAKKRLVLVSHSWGTILGLKLIQRRPERFYAYVGLGQFVDFARSEKLGFEATLADAQAAKNVQAVAELQAIAPYPDAKRPERNLANLPKERHWLAAFNGYYWHGGFGHGEALAEFSPNYTAADLIARNAGMQRSNQLLWDALGRVNFIEDTRFACPLVFMHGRHDRGTSASILGEWFETLQAPSKKLIWFEDSAHMVYEEEPGKVLVSLVQTVLPLAHD